MTTADPSEADGRAFTRVANGALALLGGALVALALPPWGWWPLAFVGLALFELAIGDTTTSTPTRAQRFRRGWLFGAGWTYLGMGWMTQLSTPGYFAAGAIFGCYHGVAAMLAPTGRWGPLGRPAAHALAEALRFSFPFGGVPLASLAIGQVGGPLADSVRVGGALLLTWMTLQLGMAIPSAVRGWRGDTLSARPGAVGAALAVAVGLLATVAPTSTATGQNLAVAIVQGGGEQGTRALDVPSSVVTERHLDATRTIARSPDGPVPDLVVWPENTVDVNLIPFVGSSVAQSIGTEAARLGVPILAGITEDEFDSDGRTTGRYTNAQVVVMPDGSVADRYDKVRRVPFGEYVPLRGVLEQITSAVDQVGDAVPGGPKLAYLDVPVTVTESTDATTVRLATVISWEVFFGGRAREGVREGGQAIINPTNGASYTGTIVQTQQVASSRLRAIETGRWVIQAAPTGFSAFISPDGDVVQRTSLRERRVLWDDVELRDGQTWYTRNGDAPTIVAITVLLVAAWVLTMRNRSTGSKSAAAHDVSRGR